MKDATSIYKSHQLETSQLDRFGPLDSSSGEEFLLSEAEFPKACIGLRGTELSDAWKDEDGMRTGLTPPYAPFNSSGERTLIGAIAGEISVLCFLCFCSC